ncbi:glutamine amidotransferase [Nibrella saemangeumensis]|uniref:Glutamine amidotransferase n=1 Tax=Nibrella saemangeumensis TaxID=1084526 RepID=A0ABP8NTZ3_9BACT
MRSDLLLQSSPWWIVVCLLVGAAYAAAMYQPLPGRSNPGGWGKTANYALAALRFIVVTLLCLLLLNPLVRNIRSTTEKAKVVLAVDNSESMIAGGRAKLDQTLSAVDKLRQQLADQGVEVAVRTLGDTATDVDLSQLSFTRRTTDLSGLLAGIRNDYEGRHLTDVVLITDGVFNQGLSPTFGQYPFAVHAVGVGDTVPKRDVQLKAALANRVAYLGNRFPVQAEIVSNGYQGQTGVVVLRQGGREVGRQTISFGRPETFSQVTFQASADQKGVQHYVVEVLPLSGEFSTRNNRQDVYIDVIDGKEKILLLGLTPHPDIKALRSIIERNQNYELDIRLLTGSTDPNPPADKVYDLIILHQIPDNSGLSSGILQRLLARNTPVLFVLGNQSAPSLVNTLNPVMQITAQGNQTDKTTARFEANFRQVNLDPTKLEILEKLPPLLVPYGDYKLQPGTEVVLWQQVGSVKTSKPLLALNMSGTRKAAVLAGEGLWQWRQEEYALTDKQEIVDELLQKIMQFISVKEDRRKLRVYPIRNEFVAGEKVIFETELYNNIYERIYDQPIRLEITDEKSLTRTFNYTPTTTNSRFEISRLPEGVYRYRAISTLNNRSEQATGQFIVRNLQLEALNTTADHAMLRQLAQQTGGRFYGPGNIASLASTFTSQKAPDRLTSTEEMNELINWRWLFFVVLVFIGAEWGLRKFYGGY